MVDLLVHVFFFPRGRLVHHSFPSFFFCFFPPLWSSATPSPVGPCAHVPFALLPRLHMFPHFFPRFSILGVAPSPIYGVAMYGQSSLPHQFSFSGFPAPTTVFLFLLTPFVPLNPHRVCFLLFLRLCFAFPSLLFSHSSA